MFSVENNRMALNAQRQFKSVGKEKKKAAERLSSGYRINRSADDAAGLTISENMRWQIRGLRRASKNIQEGVSLIQVADAAMNEISDMLHRLKELSIQAANDTNTIQDRANIQLEVDSILEEIDDIHNKTQFNGIYVLNGSGTMSAGGLAGGGLNGPGYYFRGGLPSWIADSKGTTPLGRLSMNVTIPRATLYCRSLTDAYGNAVQNIVTDQSTTYKYQQGKNVNNGYLITDMDVLNIPDGTVKTVQITGMDGQLYTAEIEYQHGTDQYAAAALDFSKATASNIQELVRQGFYSTCTLCDKHYSIEFVDKGGAGDGCTEIKPSGSGGSGGDYIYTIDVNGITSGDALIDKIISVLGNPAWGGVTHDKYDVGNKGHYVHSAKPQGHFADFAAEVDANGNRTGRLLVISTEFDNGSAIRPIYPNFGLYGFGIYDYSADGKLPPDAQLLNQAGGLHIQTGPKQGDAVYISLPKVSCRTLGISWLSVRSRQEADYGIAMTDAALSYLSLERSNLGAWQNRLEHADSIVQQTAENVQAAESRIRDCDLAQTVVNDSIQNILLQMGVSMMAQANQRQEMLLSLLN